MSVLINNNKKTRRNGRFSCFLVLVISLFLIPCISYADVAGKVIFSIGKAQIKSVSGEITRLRRGDQVNNGDTIITSRKAQVQIRMVDNALISVRPDSQFVLEQYVYKENPEEDKSYMKLVKGGFRSVTGQIGKRNKNNYKVSTVVGTIGIRGTDFTAMLCNSDCGTRGGNGNAKIDNGLYVGVLSGGVSLKNEAGESSLDNQQYAHVASVRSAPKRMPAPPGFLMFDRTKAEKPGAGQKKETEKEDSKKQKKEKSKVKESAKEKEKSKEKDKSKEKEKDKSENKEKKDVKATGDKKTSEEKTEDAEKDKNKEQDKKSDSKTTDEKDTGEKNSGEENSGKESSDSKDSNSKDEKVSAENDSSDEGTTDAESSDVNKSDEEPGSETSSEAESNTESDTKQEEPAPEDSGTEASTESTAETSTKTNSDESTNEQVSSDSSATEVQSDSIQTEVPQSTDTGTASSETETTLELDSLVESRVDGLEEQGLGDGLAAIPDSSTDVETDVAAPEEDQPTDESPADDSPVASDDSLSQEVFPEPVPEPLPEIITEIIIEETVQIINPQTLIMSSTGLHLPSNNYVSQNDEVSVNELNVSNELSSVKNRVENADGATAYFTVDQGTSSTQNYGEDINTGLKWGRWSDGELSQTISGIDELSTQSQALNADSVHWIIGQQNQEALVMPLTGSANYILKGNTDPTDNFGNIGVLGSASLNANFLTQKISADVKLGINNQIWQANDNNIVLNSDGSFSTNNMSVTAIDSSGVAGINSAGSAAGQLVQPLESVTNIPQGAALGYHLESNLNGVNTHVSGVAAFEKENK